MDPRTGLDGRKISSPPGFDPGPSSPYSVAIKAELPGPLSKYKDKCKVYFRTRPEGPEGEQRSGCTLSLTSVVDGCGWSTPRPRCFTPGLEIHLPTVQEIMLAKLSVGRVWKISRSQEWIARPPT